MKYDIVVIGGGPAGTVLASTAKMYYPDKKVLILKGCGDEIIPWGIPYIFNDLRNADKKHLENQFLEVHGADELVDSAVDVDSEAKMISTEKHGDIWYEKLVFATGSTAIMPKIPGHEKFGIYTINKKTDHLMSFRDDVDRAENIVIVGAGFIGAEFADEFMKLGKKVTLVEAAPRILAGGFDEDFTEDIHEYLSKGVKILTSAKVTGFEGDERVDKVLLDNGMRVDADVVLLSIGAFPNTWLAEKIGLRLGERKAISVDEYMRTSTKDVFAVGDCAEKRDFFTRARTSIMLASTATAEARIAASSLYGIKIIRENKGTLALYSTKIGDITVGCAGLTEERAKKEQFEVIVGRVDTFDKHPSCLPNTHKLKIKLLFSKMTGQLLGGQVSGGNSAAEIINMVGMAIEQNMDINDLETLQIATHPLLTAPPMYYPIIAAAQDALRQK